LSQNSKKFPEYYSQVVSDDIVINFMFFSKKKIGAFIIKLKVQLIKKIGLNMCLISINIPIFYFSS
jgi:hypothetical protein